MHRCRISGIIGRGGQTVWKTDTSRDRDVPLSFLQFLKGRLFPWMRVEHTFQVHPFNFVEITRTQSVARFCLKQAFQGRVSVDLHETPFNYQSRVPHLDRRLCTAVFFRMLPTRFDEKQRFHETRLRSEGVLGLEITCIDDDKYVASYEMCPGLWEERVFQFGQFGKLTY